MRTVFRIQRLIPWLVRMADFLAMTAVIASGDVPNGFAIPIVLVGLLAWCCTRFKILKGGGAPNSVLFSILILLIATALVYEWHYRLHPVILATYLGLSVHVALWFGRVDLRHWAVRLMFGLINVALAAVLTPDLYIAGIIFLFVMIASLSVSGLYLAKELGDSELPLTFLAHNVSISFIVFLLSLLIFPILPRARSNLGSQWQSDRTQTGYQERVNLGILSKRIAGEGEERAAARFFLPIELQDGPWVFRFHQNLVRGRVLDYFDGKQWVARDYLRSTEAHHPATVVRPGELIRMEGIREPMGSDVLPVPYGTFRVLISRGATEIPPQLLGNGTWAFPGSENRRVQYFVESIKDEQIWAKPMSIHLQIPSDWIANSERWRQLARKLFQGTQNESEKIVAVTHFFKKSGFEASLDPLEGVSSSGVRLKLLNDPRRQLDLFLFGTKRGTCEYFASAAAFLLRLGGVPSRLVSGFRISKNPIAGVLTLKQGDAHAWVEAWDPKAGWIPLDPTPHLTHHSSLWREDLLLLQDYLTAYWYRYVLAFDQNQETQKSRQWFNHFLKSKNLEPESNEKGTAGAGKLTGLVLALLVGLALVGLAGLILRLLRSFFGLGQGFAPRIAHRIRWRRTCMERWVKKNFNLAIEEWVNRSEEGSAAKRWYNQYVELRFQDPKKVNWEEAVALLDQAEVECHRSINNRLSA